jgi:phosphoglycerate kinase
MGVFEFDYFATGTNAIAKAIAQLENVYAVVGGGDSISAINKLNLKAAFSHISTGGGAMLEFLAGEKLVIFQEE